MYYEVFGVIEDFGESVDVVGVGVRDEPCGDIVAEGGEEAAKEWSVAFHAAVDDDDFTVAAFKDVAVHL